MEFQIKDSLAYAGITHGVQGPWALFPALPPIGYATPQLRSPLPLTPTPSLGRPRLIWQVLLHVHSDCSPGDRGRVWEEQSNGEGSEAWAEIAWGRGGSSDLGGFGEQVRQTSVRDSSGILPLGTRVRGPSLIPGIFKCLWKHCQCIQIFVQIQKWMVSLKKWGFCRKKKRVLIPRCTPNDTSLTSLPLPLN